MAKIGLIHITRIDLPQIDQDQLVAIAREIDEVVLQRFGQFLDVPQCKISISPNDNSIVFAYMTREISETHAAELERNIPKVIEEARANVERRIQGHRHSNKAKSEHDRPNSARGEYSETPRTMHDDVPSNKQEVVTQNNEANPKRRSGCTLWIGLVLGLAITLFVGVLGLGLLLKWPRATETVPIGIASPPASIEWTPSKQANKETVPSATLPPSTPKAPSKVSMGEWLPEGARLRLGGGDISQIAFSPDGNYLIAVGQLGLYFYPIDSSGQFEFWGAPEPKHRGENWWFARMALSSDGHILVGVWGNYFVVWDIDFNQRDWPKQARYKTLWAGGAGIDGSVTGITISPNGEMLAIRTDEGEVEIINPHTQRTISTLWDDQVMPCYSCSIQCDSYDVEYGSFAFSPDGNLIVDSRSCSRGGDIETETYVWNVEWSSLDFKVPGRSSVALFSQDARFLFTIEYEGINVWDTSTGDFVDALSYSFDSSYYVAESAAFSSDGNALYTGSYDGTLDIWDVDDKTLLKTLAVPTGVFNIALSPDGYHIAYLTGEGDIVLNNATLEKEGAVIASHTPMLWGYDFSHVMFSPDNMHVLWAVSSGVRAWDVANGDLAYRIRLDEGELFYSINFSKSKIVTLSETGKAQIWSALNGESLASLEVPALSPVSETGEHILDVDDLLFSPDGNLLAGRSSSFVYIWDAATGFLVMTIDTSLWGESAGFLPDYSNVFGVAFSPDASLLAILLEDNSGEHDEVLLWAVPHGQQPLQVIQLEKEISGWSTFVKDGQQLVVEHYGEEPSYTVWDVQTGEMVTELPAGYKRAIATGSGDILAIPNSNTLVLWNTTTWEAGLTLKSGPAGVDSARISTVAFSPDAHWIAAGTEGGEILIWEVETGERIAMLKGHQGAVVSLQFSSDNSLLASASEDGSLLIWEMRAVLP